MVAIVRTHAGCAVQAQAHNMRARMPPPPGAAEPRRTKHSLKHSGLGTRNSLIRRKKGKVASMHSFDESRACGRACRKPAWQHIVIQLLTRLNKSLGHFLLRQNSGPGPLGACPHPDSRHWGACAVIGLVNGRAGPWLSAKLRDALHTQY
jgi:hypothetical protein